MRYAVVDDEELAIDKLKSVLEKVNPSAEIHTFRDAEKFLSYLEQTEVDVAFLDVEMPEMNGLMLTRKIKDVYPKTGVIFVTGYSQYALEAHGLYVSGFLLKPATAEKVREALDYLRPIAPVKIPHIRVQCFGNFDVFVDGELLTFPRSKSKELLAYLVHCAGSSATAAEIAAVLWEDKPYDRSLQNQTQKIISVMMQTLKSAGIEEIVIKKQNSIRIDESKFECDYYDFLKWDTRPYTKEYMQCYSWAEMTAATLSRHSIYSNQTKD